MRSDVQAKVKRQSKRKPNGATRRVSTYPIEVAARRCSKMKVSDERVIEFLSGGPLKSFAATLDALRYLDGVSIPHDVEFELFDDALGDNAEGEFKIRVPEIRGIPASALLSFVRYAQAFNIVRRRPRTVLSNAPEEIEGLYELTPSGRYVVKILEVLTDVTSASSSQ